MPQLDRLWYTIDAETRGFDEGILKSGDKLKNFTEYAKGAPLVVLGALAAAAIVAGAKIAQMGAEFEYAMARVNTAAQLTKPQLDALGQGVLRISRETGAGLDDLTRGLYDIVSSGIPASKALEVLGVAAKGAIGGVTNVSVVVDGLTSILNAYRDENLDVAKVQDQMFEAVNKGKITYEELAGSIGQVVGIAATMHISLDDLLGVITQLSLQGIKSSEAITGVRAAIENIIKPSQQFSQLFPELAAQFNEGRLRGEGFTKFLLDLQVAAKGNNQVFATLFGSVEAYKTVLAALQHDGRDTAAMQQDIANATGSADAAFKTMNETTVQTEARLKTGLNTALTDLGQRLLPVVNLGLESMIGLLQLVTKGLPGTDRRAIENIHEFERAVLDTTGALSTDQFETLTTQVNAFVLAVNRGAIDVSKFSTEELSTLDTALSKIVQQYKYLGQTVGPVHTQIEQLLADRRRAFDDEARAAAQKRQDSFAAIGLDVTQGRQSAREILTPPTQSQAYLTALRQRDAITKAIAQSEKDLAKAAEDAQQALATGDDAALADARKRADASRASIEAQRATMKQALGEIYQYDVRLQQLMNGLTGQVADMLAKATHSAADDLTAELKKLDNQVDHVKAKGGIVDQAAVDRVHALFQGMILVAREADETKKTLEATAHADNTRGTPEDFEALGARQLQLQLQLDALDSQALGYLDRRRDLEGQINAIIQRRTELTDRNLESNKKIADDQARRATKQLQLIRDQAEAVDSLIKAGIALGAAFGGIDQQVASVLSNLSTIGTSIGPFLKTLDAFNAQTKDSSGNLVATFSTVVAAAMPLIGAATSIIGSLFGGGPDPERQRQQQVIQDNTAAIERLTGVMAHFGDVAVTGEEATKVQQAARAAIAIGNTPGPSKRIVEELQRQLKALGLTMSDLDDIAKKYGVTIDHTNTNTLYASLQALLEAIQKAPITYMDTFTDNLARLNAEFEVMGTAPIDQLSKLVALLVKTSPAFKKALEGLDLSTDEGRQAAIAALQKMFADFESGTVSIADLGGLTPEQFVQEIQDAIKRLQSGASGVSGTGGYNVSREITETSAGALIAQATTANVWLERITTASEASAAALRGTSLGALPALTPPSLPGAPSPNGANGVVINLGGIILQLTVQPGQPIGDTIAAAQRSMPQLAEEIDRALRDRLLRRDRLNGNPIIR